MGSGKLKTPIGGENTYEKTIKQSSSIMEQTTKSS